MITLHDLQFTPFIGEDEITRAIDKLSAKLNEELADENPLFIGVLNGAFMFASEVIKRFDHNCEVSFVKLSSYSGIETTNEVHELIGFQEDIAGRTIVVLEDIVDTGNTIEVLAQLMKDGGCKSFKIATLFFKPEAYTKEINIDYIGISIPNKFIVGCGLDYNGLGRNLTEVYQLKSNNMTNLVLFGPPGAGKGTQAEVLKQKYSLIHISTGDVFRYNIKNATELGTLAKSYIDKGQLVPDEVTINMLNAEVDKNPEANGFIFDGFPRTEAQADSLAELLTSKGAEVSAMVALEVDDEVLVQRLLERGKTSGRPDDADEGVIRNRIKVYYDETAILKNYYQKQDKYFGVDGVGAIDEITERLSIVIDKL
ncbi:adenylate kinase [Aquimarina sp. 2201CG5-10]|uniref:adenylate kinase n=1 Tax=Aquimarina callyspongiae TaxID=3098150 RepID=UPI002AB400BF|nr:adenylate kinase [Aquimarina sp. 2201CG5-10]MDY8134480.1 adenylate kinase [Aquimarina sp. 2201CG5-10]